MYIFNEIHSDLNTDICPVKSFISESNHLCTRSNCVRFIAYMYQAPNTTKRRLFDTRSFQITETDSHLAMNF